LAFAPVVLQTYPDNCLTPQPPWVNAALAAPGSVATTMAAATGRALRNYRDPQRMQFVKLVDGGLTDNQGLASILIARTVSGTPYGPLTRRDAVRLRRMLFWVVDAGRPPLGDWALQLAGPSGVDVGIAAADAAIDSATRLSAAAFGAMVEEWRLSIVKFRCGLTAEEVRLELASGDTEATKNWRCEDVQFFVDTLSAESLAPERAARLRNVPTRLALSREDIDDTISGGRDAALRSVALRQYLIARFAQPAR
jgi:NTE family protein